MNINKTLISLVLVLFVSVDVWAQEKHPVDTPRKKIIRDLQAEIITSLESVKVEDEPVLEFVPEVESTITPETIVVPKSNVSSPVHRGLAEIIQTENYTADKIPSVDLPTLKMPTRKMLAQENVAHEPAKSILPPAEAKKSAPSTLLLNSVPFFVTAQEYVMHRGREKSGQIILDYDVTRQNPANLLPRVQKVRLVLGEDYVVLSRGEITKIYDFKLNRILKITPQISSDGKKTGKRIFANGSIYTRVFQNMKTVGKITQNGKLRNINLGATESLDAFWVESAMSWMAAQADTHLEVSAEKTRLEIIRKGEVVLAAKFADTAYKTSKYRDNLLAFAHHEWSLHPHVLQALYPFKNPITSFEFRTYGPRMPKGETQKWVLTQQTQSFAAFPLSTDILSVTELTPKPPLAVVIRNAAQNKPKMRASFIESEFYAQYDKGAYYKAWIFGQKYISHTGACDKKSDAQICGLISDIEARADMKSDKKFQAIAAVQNMPKGLERLSVLKAIKPYIEDADILASTLRTVAMARAKITAKQAQDIGFGGLGADDLLIRALKKFPYDPQTYLALAQVYAASGAVEQSWDIYDALRVGQNLKRKAGRGKGLKVNHIEAQIRRNASGYFLEN